jgi:hypothetical protein
MYTELAFVYRLCNRKVHIHTLGDPRWSYISAIYNYFSDLELVWRLGTVVALPPDQTTNPNTEERKMRTDGQTIRGNEMDMGRVKGWAKKTFAGERISVVSCELVVAAYVGIVLAQVFLSY